MFKMGLVFLFAIAVNVGVCCFFVWNKGTYFSPFVQVLIALPVCIVNMASIWWLYLGGRWRA